MVLHAVKKIPKATWTNDRDAFYAPNGGIIDAALPDSGGRAVSMKPPSIGLPSEFVTDCGVWSAFSNKNNCTALKDVKYQGDVWQIPIQMYPFMLEEVRRWPCGHGDIAAQLATANEDRFLAKWLAGRHTGTTGVSPVGDALSLAACAVLDAARALYRDFYANITHTPWMDWKIETWDAGYYQIRNAMKDIFSTGKSLRAFLRAAEIFLSPCLQVLGAFSG